ncbi:organic solute transporter alpha-like protein [Schistocerca serialis cubense]|uniref:organic solute transporter alpha-like protein n=1 Tax=Schistocerca serialis cubense TaxID=2023355 RepID=UPI00214E71E1|nr:organic solute transporter alpha-like protein [Schistocerca serialis cubense]
MASDMAADSWSVGNTTYCNPDTLPSLREYYGAVDPLIIVLVCTALAVVAVTIALYSTTMRDIVQRAPREVKGDTAAVLAIHPVGAVIVFLSLLVPRADFLVEVVLQGTFVVCLYKFFCLLVAYGGGEEELTLKLRPAAFQPITGPCCCCPCCRLCCSPLEVSKSSLTRIRVLILQLPVVQWLIDLVLFVLLAEDQAVYQAVYQWVQVVPMVSLMVALWGANMFLSLLGDALAEHRVRSKFVAMQVVVALNAMLKAVSRPIAAALACYPPLTPALYCHMVVDMALLVINLAMAAWGRDLYRRDLPKIVLTSIRRLSGDATTSPQTSPRHTRHAPAIVAA